MDERVIAYIKEMEKQGYTAEAIRKALLDAGHQAQSVDEYMLAVQPVLRTFPLPNQALRQPRFYQRATTMVPLALIFVMILVIVVIIWRGRSVSDNKEQVITAKLAELNRDLPRPQTPSRYIDGTITSVPQACGPDFCMNLTSMAGNITTLRIGSPVPNTHFGDRIAVTCAVTGNDCRIQNEGLLLRMDRPLGQVTP